MYARHLLLALEHFVLVDFFGQRKLEYSQVISIIEAQALIVSIQKPFLDNKGHEYLVCALASILLPEIT